MFIVNGIVNKDHKSFGTKRGDIVWLTKLLSTLSWTTKKELAHEFESVETARKASEEATGPWFNMPDMRIIEVWNVE